VSSWPQEGQRTYTRYRGCGHQI